jgi:predicted O-methyltransferase YrrM
MNINTSPNTKRCEINDVRKMVNFYNLVGDIVEFGTFSCESAIKLSKDFNDRKIYTIDHFEGLEKTSILKFQ